jgi:hypothetical protein
LTLLLEHQTRTPLPLYVLMAQQQPFPFSFQPASQPPTLLQSSGERFVFSGHLAPSTDDTPDVLVGGGVRLGTHLFKTSDALFNYMHNALMNTKIGQEVRYDECIILLDLLKKGHERATEKLGCGISSIKVEYHPGHPRSKCFMLYRKDGSKEDFSCILFSAFSGILACDSIRHKVCV